MTTATKNTRKARSTKATKATRTPATAGEKATIAKTVAALRKRAVKDDNRFPVKLDCETAWLLIDSDNRNRPKNLRHVGALAKALRLFGTDDPDRYVQGGGTAMISDERMVDFGHRAGGVIVAYGTEDDWRRLALLPQYNITTAVNADDPDNPTKTVRVADLAKMRRLFDMEPLETRQDSPVPTEMVSVEVDDHYFRVADQVFNKRSGADMLVSTPDIANRLLAAGISGKTAEVVCRMVYLRCYCGLEGRKKDGPFGSVRKGGAMGAGRYVGIFRALVGDALIKAKEIFDKAQKVDGAWQRDRLDAIGIENILTALTLGILGAEKQDHFVSNPQFLTFKVKDAIAAVTAIGYTTTGAPSAGDTAAKHLLAECTRPKVRISIAERIAALCEIVGHTDGVGSNPPATYAEWSKWYVSAIYPEDANPKDMINPEQQPAVRFYGPDSTGWTKDQIIDSKQQSNG